jgi:hypothetical protein
LPNEKFPEGMIKLLSTDFDGTLVSHEQQPAVSPELFDLLFECIRSRGLRIKLKGLRNLRFPLYDIFVANVLPIQSGFHTFSCSSRNDRLIPTITHALP